jgi:hypothetical protein
MVSHRSGSACSGSKRRHEIGPYLTMRAALLKIVSFLKERALEEIFREKY